MAVSAEVQVVVKHTFLEVVESPTSVSQRCRAETCPSWLTGSDQSTASPSSSSPASPRLTHEADPADCHVDSKGAGLDPTVAWHPTFYPDECSYSPRWGDVQWSECWAECAAHNLGLADLESAYHAYQVPWPAPESWFLPGEVTCLEQSVSGSQCATAVVASQGQEAQPSGPLTTVMLRNLPKEFTRAALLELVDSEGFAGLYDFAYLPVDFNTEAGLGYGFINCVTPAVASRFWDCFEGFSFGNEKCVLQWSHPHQGVEAHVERYRNSPVMHPCVSDQFKPLLFRDGIRVPFPPPTKPIKEPRKRSRK